MGIHHFYHASRAVDSGVVKTFYAKNISARKQIFFGHVHKKGRITGKKFKSIETKEEKKEGKS